MRLFEQINFQLTWVAHKAWRTSQDVHQCNYWVWTPNSWTLAHFGWLLVLVKEISSEMRLQHTGSARLVWGRLRVHPIFHLFKSMRDYVALLSDHVSLLSDHPLHLYARHYSLAMRPSMIDTRHANHVSNHAWPQGAKRLANQDHRRGTSKPW